jgi:hypothetical protein
MEKESISTSCNTSSKEKITQKRVTDGTLNKWRQRYTWVRIEFDKEAKLLKLFCEWCEKAKLVNNMTRGCVDIQNSALEYHTTTADHELARRSHLEDKKPMETTKKNLDFFFKTKKEQLSYEMMIPTFRNVLWLAKECLPLYKAESLHLHCKSQGVEVSEHYRNHLAAREILTSINQVLVNSDIRKLRETNFVGISIDSSTDTSSRENLIITIRFVNQSGFIEERYLKLLELSSKKGKLMFDTLKPYLIDMNIFCKISSISTDGEACMLSDANGLVGKFKDELPHILSTHCVAHRLVLGSKPLCQDILELRALNNLVHSICSFFHRSPKKMRVLLKEEEDDMGEELRILMPNDERWLSHLPCLERIIELYVPIINTLTELCGEYPVALAILTQLCRVKISALLHFAVDLIRPLYNLSKIFQRKNLTIKEMKSGLEAVRARMFAFIHGEIGVSASLFMSKLDKTTLTYDNKILLDKKSCNGFEEVLSEIQVVMQKAANLVLQQLDLRFPEDHRLYLLDFLSPSAIKQVSPGQLQDYGNAELADILEAINNGLIHHLKRNQVISRTTNIMETWENHLLSVRATREEWMIVKNLIQFEYKSFSDEEIYEKIHTNPMLCNVRKIYEFVRSIPLTSVECERMFSRMNLIKTNLRNQLEESTLDSLIRISVSSVDMKTFNFHEAFSIWRQEKHRYFA